MTREIVNYIRSNPTGCSISDILVSLPEGTKPRSVNTILQYLKRMKVVENNGERGTKARWYSTVEKVDPQYMHIAQDLERELAEVHHTLRTEYFARRLQEIFGS
jgi:transcription initiation factor IIE alpha subunit